MKQKILFLMSGPPGCGKSTWIERQLWQDGGTWISRDNIRFGMLKEGEDYFAHEDEVFDTFIHLIQEEINDSSSTRIYVDATHLNKTARNKVLKQLDLSEVDEINCVFFNIDSETCIERNEQRTGLARVPRSVIRRMWHTHTMPDADENFDKIIIIDKEGNEVIK